MQNLWANLLFLFWDIFNTTLLGVWISTQHEFLLLLPHWDIAYENTLQTVKGKSILSFYSFSVVLILSLIQSVRV